MSISKKKFTIKEYQRYIKINTQYNDTLLVGITKNFINNKVWYKCDKCCFGTKHKYDCLKHYTRIHINNGKSTYKKKK